MRKVIVIFALIIGSFGWAQNHENRFSDSEEEQMLGNSAEKEPEMAENTGPPGGDDPDPIPIDNYIPLLVILAAGLITYKTYGRKSLS